MEALARNENLEVRLGVFVDTSILSMFPEQMARKYKVVPLQRLGKGLIVGTLLPPSEQHLAELSKQIGVPVAAIPCHVSDLQAVYESLYGSGSSSARKLGEILRHDQIISDRDLEQALLLQQEKPKPIGQILLDLGLISSTELSAGLSGQEREKGPALSPSLFINPKLTQLLPESQALQYRVLPLALMEGKLVLATASHLDGSALSELTALTGHQIRQIPAVSSELEDALRTTYRRHRKSRLKELRLGELLKAEGLIEQHQLEECLAGQKKTGEKLGEIVVRKGFAREESVFGTLAAKLGCEYCAFSTTEIDLELSRFISKRFAERNNILLLSEDSEKRVIKVAMADPADLNLRDILQGILAPHGYDILPVLSSPENIRNGLAYTYRPKGLTVLESADEMESVLDSEKKGSGEDLLPSEELPEIKRLVNQFLYLAVTEGASDIHIENHETEVKIRFRIDGILDDRALGVTKQNIQSVISILKLDSGLDIAERRRSQDGMFKKRIGKTRFIDFRINVHATPFGEDAVIRILDREKNLLPLERLGFDKTTFSAYRSLIENPQGLILFTGPTGSGKTTTLYSTLMHLNQANRKIVTAEDPIEYTLKGISQYQVNETIGNTFDDYAQRFLRKDPDIILIGEIRDSKTAKACISAAMTGHLVFSTLHTNDSIGVVLRLQNLGCPQSSIADSLLLVVSQRLARRVCVQCRKPHRPDERLLKEFFPKGVPSDIEFVKGEGCESCRFRGYRGRVGLYEFWEIQREARRKITEEVSEELLRDCAIQENMEPLLKDALRKVRAQVTTLEELSRVVSIEQVRRYAHHDH